MLGISVFWCSIPDQEKAPLIIHCFLLEEVQSVNYAGPKLLPSGETNQAQIFGVSLMENLGGNISSSEYSNAQRDIMIDAMADQDHLIRPYFCNVCNVICSGFASYQQHLEGTRHRRNEAPSSRELTCAICNISVNSEEQLNFHRHGTKHRRRAARQPPLLVPSASSTNQNSTAISHGQLLGSPNWYNSPPSHIPLPNTNNHASSSLNNDADNTFLNAVDHQAPYSLSTHSSLPDLISLLPGVMDDLSSAAKASVCEGRHSVESVSVSTPCFLASSAAAVQGSASLQCSLQSLMQETLNEIDRLEQQLARNLTRCRNSALLYRPRLAASRRRARRSLGCGETTRFSSFRLSALCPNSLARKSATSRSAVASALEVPSIHVQFCQHTICLSLRALLNYQNGLKRTIVRIRRKYAARL